MMYMYRRNKRFPPIRARLTRDSKDCTNGKHEPSSGGLKPALYAGICIMLILSVFFASRAGAFKTTDSSILAYDSAALTYVSGSDGAVEDNIKIHKVILSQEIPIIYGIVPENSYSVQPIEGLKNTEIDFDIATDEIKMEIVKYAQEPKSFYVGADGPQILIYHTHYEEAYRQILGEEYVEAGNFYTRDEMNSVVAVGEALKAALEGRGYSALHDKTDHMADGLKTAYSKSLVTMEKYASQYPTLKVYIDVHRDASDNQNDFVTVNGDECARVMFVVGPNKTPEEEPKFESNYKLALALTKELEGIKKGFTRPIRVQNSSKHYNQQMSDMCLLIEVGHNANSLKQAINTTKYVAQAISDIIEISGS